MSTSVDIPDDYTFTLHGGLTITVPLMEVNSKVIGDKSQPVAVHVTGDSNQPVTSLIHGDSTKPVTSLIQGDPTKPVTTTIQGNENQPITTTVQGNRQKPIASEFEVLNLPRLNKQDIKDILTPEVRVKMPNYNKICFKLFDIEFFSICTGGEYQIITEPYVPNAYERCEIPCCEPDTRPFPETRG